MERRTLGDVGALGLATAVHALLLLGLSFIPVAQESRGPVAIEDTEILIELIEPPTPTPKTEAPEEPTFSAGSTQRPRRAVPRPRTHSSPGTLAVIVAQEGEGASVHQGTPGTAPEGGSGDGSAGTAPEGERRPSLALEQLGVGARLGYPLVPRPRVVSRKQAAQTRLRKSMAEPVAQRDVELGLGPQGPLLGALEGATRRAVTEVNATALFLARFDKNGRLTHLSVAEASKDHRAWRDAARQAQQRLGAKALKMPDGARGMTLTIRVTAREQLPSGADPGVGVSMLGIPLKRGKGDNSPQIGILTPKLPKLEMVEIPNPDGGDPLRLPQVRFGLNALDLAIDPADIGAHAQRIIRAHVVTTEVM